MVAKASPVKSVHLRGRTWINGNQLARRLGYTAKSVKQAIKKHVADHDKQTLQDLLSKEGQLGSPLRRRLPNGNDLKSYYITNNGARSVVGHSRLPGSIAIAEELGIDMVGVKISFREMETIAMVREVFKGEEMHTQFPVGDYRIDLYFARHKIALECDEQNHADRDPQAELIRQEFITHQLGCRWVRFNPDSPTLRIGQVLNNIYNLLKN